MLLIGSIISRQLQKNLILNDTEHLRGVLQPLPPQGRDKCYPREAAVSFDDGMQLAAWQNEVGQGPNASDRPSKDPHIPFALYGFHKGCFTCINPIPSEKEAKPVRI